MKSESDEENILDPMRMGCRQRNKNEHELKYDYMADAGGWSHVCRTWDRMNAIEYRSSCEFIVAFVADVYRIDTACAPN